ncbi:MAG TPA: histidine phosphatase family protein [Usitatibacter sp.]|nr:histidine phosphatase family protein [Usitatibacter sp.]
MGSRRDFLAAALAVAAAPRAFAQQSADWERLRKGGHVLLMRHAATTVAGVDPKGFRLGECKTQLNLSDDGRAQARRAGQRLAEEKVPVSRVYTSPWCRCRETGLLAFGKAEDWEPLGTFFYEPTREEDFTKRVKARIGTYSSRDMGGNIVMITHNTNIAALTKLSVATGEIVVLKPDGCCGFKVEQRLDL